MHIISNIWKQTRKCMVINIVYHVFEKITYAKNNLCDARRDLFISLKSMSSISPISKIFSQSLLKFHSQLTNLLEAARCVEGKYWRGEEIDRIFFNYSEKSSFKYIDNKACLIYVTLHFHTLSETDKFI